MRDNAVVVGRRHAVSSVADFLALEIVASMHVCYQDFKYMLINAIAPPGGRGGAVGILPVDRPLCAGEW
jgi:hypothetical protein